jgi:hypothetical protein
MREERESYRFKRGREREKERKRVSEVGEMQFTRER